MSNPDEIGHTALFSYMMADRIINDGNLRNVETTDTQLIAIAQVYATLAMARFLDDIRIELKDINAVFRKEAS